MWMRAFAITAVLLLSTPAMAQTTEAQLEQARRDTEFAKLKLEKLKAEIEIQKLIFVLLALQKADYPVPELPNLPGTPNLPVKPVPPDPPLAAPRTPQ